MEKVTCLCIGDPHFQDSNMKDVAILTQKIVEYAEKVKPTFIVCMGDILHTHEKISVTPFKAATEFLKKLSDITITYLLIGNHDYKNNSQFLTNNHAFNALKQWKNMFIVDNVLVHEYNGVQFGFCPYVAPGRFLEALNSSGELWEMTDCIFAHQEFYGCQMGAIKSEIGDEWDADNPFVISGHIHDHQTFDNIFYTGSIMQHGFNENSKKYLWQFTFSPEEGETSRTYKKIDLGMKRKKIIYVDIDDIAKLDLDKYKNYHLKIDLKGHSEQFKAFRQSKKYKEFVARGIKFSFSPIHKELPELKEQFGYKNQTYISILKDLASHESEGVQLLCKEVTRDFSDHERVTVEPAVLEFCD